LFALYVLPFLVVALAILIGFCRAQHYERETLREELEELQVTLRQREKERDTALQELFLRFSEEGKLSREKSQFQAKLAEYEKYAALTQLALGAAHEINNPLLGILSHLELELDTAAEDDRHEIEQCIEAARRISVTLRSLMNYARPSPLILSKLNLHRLVSDTLAFLQHQPMLHGRILEPCAHGSPKHPRRRQPAFTSPDEPAAELRPGNARRRKDHSLGRALAIRRQR